MPRTCHPTIGQFLAEAGQPPIEELIGELAWLDQVDFSGQYCNVRGVIKPDQSLKTPAELRAQLTDSYLKIVAILEGAGLPFYKMPELELTGGAYRTPAGPIEFVEIEARIRIELVAA